MSSLNEPVAKHIAKFFRLLGSDFEGDVLAAVQRHESTLLEAEGLSFHDIAIVIENHNGEIEERKYSDSDAEQIFVRGVEKGRAEEAQRRDLPPEFYDADGQPRWNEIALFCRKNIAQLRSEWEREFITDMAGKTLWQQPSEKQAKYLLGIFIRLGGVYEPNNSKPHTYVADITQLPKALRHITGQKRWVVWRWELRKRKNGALAWTKPPYQCAHPKTAAKSNAPSTWGTYAEAVAAVAAGRADGIGFMLKDSEVAAADLDHVRDAQTGEIIGWAKRLCVEADQLGLYREVTVSGSGLRFIGLSHGSELHRKFTFHRKSGAGIELYRNTARYITISGLQEGSCEELPPIDDYLDTLVARFDQQPTATSILRSSRFQ